MDDTGSESDADDGYSRTGGGSTPPVEDRQANQTQSAPEAMFDGLLGLMIIVGVIGLCLSVYFADPALAVVGLVFIYVLPILFELVDQIVEGEHEQRVGETGVGYVWRVFREVNVEAVGTVIGTIRAAKGGIVGWIEWAVTPKEPNGS